MECRYCGSQWQSRIEVQNCPFCGRSLAEPAVFTDIGQALHFILDAYGEQVNGNPNSILAYLSDLAPALTKERRLLKICVDAGIFREFLSITDEAERGRASKRAAVLLNSEYFIETKRAEEAVGWITAAMSRTSAADRVEAAPQTQQGRIRRRHEELKKYAGRIVCSRNHILALRTDGSVIAYGEKNWGLCDVGDWQDVTTIACSHLSSVGLTKNGQVFYKGKGLPNPTRQQNTQNTQNTLQIVSQGWYPVGLCANGTVWCNLCDRLRGCSCFCQQHDQVCSDWRNVTAIACSFGTNYGLLANGTVVACGDNRDGQCSVGDWRDVVSIMAGEWTIYGIRKDGRVYAQGNNNYGQYEVNGWQNIIDIAPSFLRVLGLKSDGSVVHVGREFQEYQSVYTWTDIVEVACGGNCAAGLKADGTVVTCCKTNALDTSGWRNIVSIVCGDRYVAGLQADGTVVFAGVAINGEESIAGENLFR